MKNQIAYIFESVDMRCNHLGLKELMKKKKIKIDENFVMFINARRTILKMFCKSTSVLLHYKNENRPIDPGVLRYLPKYVNGTEIHMNKASAEHILDIFKSRGYTAGDKTKKKKKRIYVR